MDGYYDSLLTFIDKAVDDGFIKPVQRHIIVSAPTAKELVQKLEVPFEDCHSFVKPVTHWLGNTHSIMNMVFVRFYRIMCRCMMEWCLRQDGRMNNWN